MKNTEMTKKNGTLLPAPYNKQRIKECMDKIHKYGTPTHSFRTLCRITKTPFILLFVILTGLLFSFSLAIYRVEKEPEQRDRTREEELHREIVQRRAWMESDTVILYTHTAGHIAGNNRVFDPETLRGIKLSFIRYTLSGEYPDSITFVRFKMLHDFYDPRVFRMKEMIFFSFSGESGRSQHIAERYEQHWQIINVWNEAPYTYTIQNDSLYQLILVGL